MAPSAMGVQIAHPKDLVIDVAGEASIPMNIQELSTIKQYDWLKFLFSIIITWVW